jgi:alkylhydroperoxidase/carboxymuconolactone decarboxylase family protein YurZ
MDDLEERFRKLCIHLFGPEEGPGVHTWIKSTRTPTFHRVAAQVMLPVWELSKVDLKTKILCCIALFTGLSRDEVKFFLMMAKAHDIPMEQVEEILLLTGLEAGFPTAEKAIQIMQEVYAGTAAEG